MSTLLCDAGALVALINRSDANHARCAEVLSRFSGTLVTTECCLTEAMYLLSQYGGWPAQEQLWDLIDAGLQRHMSCDEEWLRMKSLMRQYRDVPMDLADASMVVAAEGLNATRVFTLDRHFYAYRIRGVQPFEVVP